MKQLGLIMGLMLILAVFAVRAQPVAPQITVTMLNQDPDPVTPGSYVDLRFSINNDATDAVAKNLQVKLDLAYPFSLDPGEDPVVSLGDLVAASSSGKNVVIVKYKVRVADKAVNGASPITLSYKTDQSNWISEQFDVNIRAVDANIAIVSVDSTPESFSPGEQGSLKIKIKNMATSSLKDVTIKLDLTFSDLLAQKAGLSATDTIAAYNALPFAPLGSSTEQKIYSLAAGEEKVFTYNLIAFPSAASQVYKVPIVINFYDELNTQYTKNDLVGIVVGSKPDMSVLIDSTDIVAGKKSGKVTIKFVNKGVTGVKFLDVKLAPTNDYDVTSAQEVYVGSVDSDDYQTAEYTLYMKSAATKVTLPVQAEYKDANNNVYSQTYNLDMNIINIKETQGSGSPIGLIVIAVIIVGAVYFFFIRGKRKK